MKNEYYFCSDLHGKLEKYGGLFKKIKENRPRVLFLGGDLLPHPHLSNNNFGSQEEFVSGYLIPSLEQMKFQLSHHYPRIFIILGNDDSRRTEKMIQYHEKKELWEYLHLRCTEFDKYVIFGYSCVPPTPFMLKDWERYDISRYVDPGCISPEEGYVMEPVSEVEMKYGTIQQDLEQLTTGQELSQAILLFHSPPYNTKLDRAALDGQTFDHVPLEVHIGSIAIRKFIEKHQPLLTLHGHVHESSRITGSWQDRIGRTFAFNAAYEGPELSLIRFNPENPKAAVRELIPVDPL